MKIGLPKAPAYINPMANEDKGPCALRPRHCTRNFKSFSRGAPFCPYRRGAFIPYPLQPPTNPLPLPLPLTYPPPTPASTPYAPESPASDILCPARSTDRRLDQDNTILRVTRAPSVLLFFRPPPHLTLPFYRRMIIRNEL
jgi:hypothetical protein